MAHSARTDDQAVGDNDGPVGRHDPGLDASAGPTPRGGPWERTRGRPESAGWWGASSVTKKFGTNAGRGKRPRRRTASSPRPRRPWTPTSARPDFPGHTRPRRKSRLRTAGRSGPRGPFSLVGSGPLGCTALLRPPGAGEATERPLWPATAARLLRGAVPTNAEAADERRGRRLRAVSPATSSGRFPGNARAARCSSCHGRSVQRRLSPGSRPPRCAVLRGAGSGGPLGALLGLAGVRVRGHLRPGGGPGAGGERGRAGCAGWGPPGGREPSAREVQ